MPDSHRGSITTNALAGRLWHLLKWERDSQRLLTGPIVVEVPLQATMDETTKWIYRRVRIEILRRDLRRPHLTYFGDCQELDVIRAHLLGWKGRPVVTFNVPRSALQLFKPLRRLNRAPVPG